MRAGPPGRCVAGSGWERPRPPSAILPRRALLPSVRKEHATDVAAPRTARIYHGWHVAWVCALSAGFSIGMAQYAFGVFAEPLEAQFHWSRAQLNAGLSIAFISGLLAPFLGRLIDRIGARPVLVASLLFVAAGFLLRPLMSQLWHWYLFNALVYAGYPGTTLLAVGRLIGLWFPRTTGRMMGLVTSGNNFGGLTMTYLATFLVTLAGWRWAYVGFGLLVAALALAAAFLVRDDPAFVQRAMARAGRSMTSAAATQIARAGLTVRQALRCPAFYLLTLGLTAASFTYSTVLTQL
ncbi:MAG: MFS transporter, partial [Gemmatimonadetes bacterium]|nr:MFS transporter [Gemmatimonadota bacterium]